MSQLLLIVSRAEPGRLKYLQHLYGSETVEVIADRRVGERRCRDDRVNIDRRRAARRRRDVSDDLRTFGWTLVRH